MKRNYRGAVLYLVLILGVIFLWFFFGSNSGSTSDYNISIFRQDLAASKIAAVDVAPSRDIPTGSVTAVMTDSTQESFYVFDTQSVIDLMEEYHFTNYSMRQDPSES